MSYDFLMQERLERFKQVLLVLPDLKDIPTELLILSAGASASKWSYRHYFMVGVTYHFIFRKAGLTDGQEQLWECVDRELNEAMEMHFKRSA